MGIVKPTKLARVPKAVWDERKTLAHLFGYHEAGIGFTIHENLMRGKLRVRKQRRKNGKEVFVLEFDDV